MGCSSLIEKRFEIATGEIPELLPKCEPNVSANNNNRSRMNAIFFPLALWTRIGLYGSDNPQLL